MRKIYETAVILIGTLGWWGFVYPELCLTEDACEQEAEREETAEDQCAWETSFWEEGVNIGEFRIKSRAAEYVYQVMKRSKEEGLKYD